LSEGGAGAAVRILGGVTSREQVGFERKVEDGDRIVVVLNLGGEVQDVAGADWAGTMRSVREKGVEVGVGGRLTIQPWGYDVWARGKEVGGGR